MGFFQYPRCNKFGDPVIVDSMRRLGELALVHPAQFVPRQQNAGDSVLIINPFEGPIVARLATDEGKELKRRILPKHAIMISLDELLSDGRWTCVQYSGNNRYPAWDVRHAYEDQTYINRIDHLEYYRGIPTFARLTPGLLFRNRTRRLMRVLGLRHN